ncbi:MAG: TraB/GumN family protein [Betaproteobacteria bacterium]|nr:TraB/GumN family protein [Betaproteobacteria bacterium]
MERLQPPAFAAAVQAVAPVCVRFAAAALAALVLAWTLPAAAQRFDRGLLWRVEGGGAQPGHVFGTIHVSDPRVTQLPAAVTRELNEARSLTVEVGLGTTNILTLANRMVFLDGRDLPGTVGPELYGKTAVLAEKRGIPEPALRLFKPWAVALLLSVPQQEPSEVLDHVLVRAATAQGKPVHELESVDEQVATFEGLPESDQVALLRRAVDQHERMPRTIGRVIEAYLARDLAAMWRIGEESGEGSVEAKRLNEAFARRLLDERNTRMVERMQARLEEGRAFIAIGALHLYGERGVLAALERRGWRVTRVH